MEPGLILVAAGYGTLRTVDGRPVSKLLETIGSEAVVARAFRSACEFGIKDAIAVVNTLYGDAIADVLYPIAERFGVRLVFVTLDRRDGAAAAVMRAIPTARGIGMQRALVMYGDMPLWSPATIYRLVVTDETSAAVTMLSVDRSFDDAFDSYGRILRDEDGIACIVEVSDLGTDAILLDVPTVNPSLWIWDLAWLAAHIPNIPPASKEDGGSELHMPRLIRVARSQGDRIIELPLSRANSFEAIGVNTFKQLEHVRAVVRAHAHV